MIIKEANVTINVKELNKSVSFYESFGLATQKRWGDHFAQMAAPGIILGLHPTTAPHLKGNSGNLSIGFTTDNFEEARDLLKKLHIPVTSRQEEGGEFLHFNDPDGTSLYFIKPKW